MQGTMTFGASLSAFMQGRGLSVAALARLMGEKSATTVSRLVHDQSSPKRCAVFLEALQQALPDLTAEELALLQRGLSISHAGVEDARAEQALTSLLCDKPLPPAPSPLSELLLAHTDADLYELYCLQCADEDILHAFDLLLRRGDQRVQIHHFLVGPLALGSAGFLSVARSFLCDARYHLIYRQAVQLSSAWMPGNMLMLRTLRHQNEQQLLIIPKPHGNYACLPLDAATDLYGFLLKASKEASIDIPPVASSYRLNTPRNCLDYLQHVYDIEKGRACFLLRAKPNLAMVPVDLLQTLYNDAPDLQRTSVKDYSLALRRICYLRYANRFERSKATHIILSQRQLKEFLQTGYLLDHFSSLRPFTPQERRLVLQHLIDHAAATPSMHLYIARDERLFDHFRFSCYDGGSVLISPVARRHVIGAQSGAPYMEACITDSLFIRQFRNLFCNVLIPRYAFSREESIAMMQDMLSAAENG